MGTKFGIFIGVYTGISTLAAAMVIPNDGQVFSLDISDEYFNQFGKKFVEQAGVAHKIQLRIQPALKTLGIWPVV